MMRSQGEMSIMIEDYKDGVMISSLVLENVTTGDYGEYSCNGSNYQGQSSSVISLLYSDTPILNTSSHSEIHRVSIAILLSSIAGNIVR